ncbi:2-oxo acid dehydrogenase subunit E2 [Sphingomonas sp. MG17]|uniref:Dihydrolipoamide acetyltransferase component of pyruvate dehydrogenase complex n=1 Tax=Sphingomonas tagetis TaxID=2949092 RepID=A0A9X2HJL1_9SPHN|nr:dihydrolipoamide acetyltransferase family protein [Sphingomonas tagetis]MCP3730289.1 2-oxo acid dehydrogenase subunit E2 [Sphingomonas tagetis]
MPDIGEGLTEAVIAGWSVKAGDAVKEDDPLCEIETDKAVVEITAPCTGTVISVRGEIGETLKVGTVITVFETEKLPVGAGRGGHGQAVEEAEPPLAQPAAPPAEIPASGGASPVAFDRAIRATPATRRLAREQGVDLATVAGTGPGGRVLQNDVMRFADGGQIGQATGATGSSGGRFTIAPIPREPGQTRQPLTGLRRVVADQMVRSVTLVPHASSSFRCEAGRFQTLRKLLQERLGTRISFTAMVMKAMVSAIQRYPTFNQSIDETTNEVVTPPFVNIGFATHTDDGLIVPVIKDCGARTLTEISGEIDRLAALARSRKIAPGDLRGGTITLSNVGSHGRAEAIGGRLIVNHPQAAIIGMTRIRPLPIVRDGQVVAAPCLDFHTSYDHRIIDGIYAGLFMEHLIDVIEEPGMMLAN